MFLFVFVRCKVLDNVLKSWREVSRELSFLIVCCIGIRIKGTIILLTPLRLSYWILYDVCHTDVPCTKLWNHQSFIIFASILRIVINHSLINLRWSSIVSCVAMNMIEFLSSNQETSHETSDTVMSRQLLSWERERLLCMKILLRLADYLSVILLLFSPRYYHELIHEAVLSFLCSYCPSSNATSSVSTDTYRSLCTPSPSLT